MKKIVAIGVGAVFALGLAAGALAGGGYGDPSTSTSTTSTTTTNALTTGDVAAGVHALQGRVTQRRGARAKPPGHAVHRRQHQRVRAQ